MKTSRRIALAAAAVLAAAALVPFVPMRPTSHAAVPSALGTPRSGADMEAMVDVPGPVTVETVIGADWSVTRAGLINLDAPKAKEAGLVDGNEPIVVVFHAVHHPARGLYLIDTGAEKALRDDPEHAALRGIAAKVIGVERLRVRTDTASWIAAQHEPVRGVFLTHLHTDHVSGMRDVPASAVVYTGPGESEELRALHFFVRGVTNDALEGKGPLQEWQFARDDSGAFDGVVDVFGDGSFWAIHVPGHTAGSTAYVARTPKGAVLFTGDACHTEWGWTHDVEPGNFSADKPQSAESLARLERFAARHPAMEVRVGHQLMSHVDAQAAR
jgi:glyoxylase-like metal-dependent hydrolase (beta-lactamase superfamily II)